MNDKLTKQTDVDSMFDEIRATETALSSIRIELKEYSRFDLERASQILRSCQLVVTHLGELEVEIDESSVDIEIRGRLNSEIVRLKLLAREMIAEIGVNRDLELANSIIRHNEKALVYQKGLLELGYMEAESQRSEYLQVLLTFLALVFIVVEAFREWTERFAESLGFESFFLFQFILFTILLLISNDLVIFISNLSRSKTNKLRKSIGDEEDV